MAARAAEAGTSPRTAGRRAARMEPLPDLTGADRAALELCLVPEIRAGVFRRAAAALHGNAIAMVVEPAARRALSEALGEEVRAFAVARRGLALLPDPALAPGDLPDLVFASEALIRDAWLHCLPPGVGEAPGSTADPRAAACLAAALEDAG